MFAPLPPILDAVQESCLLKTQISVVSIVMNQFDLLLSILLGISTLVLLFFWIRKRRGMSSRQEQPGYYEGQDGADFPLSKPSESFFRDP